MRPTDTVPESRNALDPTRSSLRCMSGSGDADAERVGNGGSYISRFCLMSQVSTLSPPRVPWSVCSQYCLVTLAAWKV